MDERVEAFAHLRFSISQNLPHSIILFSRLHAFCRVCSVFTCSYCSYILYSSGFTVTPLNYFKNDAVQLALHTLLLLNHLVSEMNYELHNIRMVNIILSRNIDWTDTPSD